MSLDLNAQSSPPIQSVDELVGSFRSAEKGPGELRLGLEHEKFLYPVGGATAVPYEGASGVGAVLESLAGKYGYAPFREHDGAKVIALQRGIETISLEPGGQFELSGSPFRTAREAQAENLRHLKEVRAVAGELGLRLVALGYRPFQTTADIPWMPKSRYRAMRASLPSRGGYALDMMQMTSTGQVSLDWTSEADCAEKVTLTARVSPLLVALYANSPLRHGKPSGFQSFRSEVWTDVDPARCGVMPFLVDGSFSYRAYVDWALDAPMLFLRRRGEYLNPAVPFREFLAKGFEGQPATHSDWTDHLSTLFPEVRIKRVLEVRGADCCDEAMTGALPALWRGLLYDAQARAEAASLLPKLSYPEHQELMLISRRDGLRGIFRNVPLWRLSRELVEISRAGLKRLDPDDAPLLDVLLEVANSGHSPAERVLKAFAADGRPEKLLDACQL